MSMKRSLTCRWTSKVCHGFICIMYLVDVEHVAKFNFMGLKIVFLYLQYWVGFDVCYMTAVLTRKPDS